jgi:hypothetical protein
VSLFFGSFSVAERRAEAGEIECPRCGSNKLERLMSRVNMVRGSSSSGDSMGDMDDIGGMDDMDGMGDMFNGLDEEDPRAMARWARRMKESLGEDADLGPEFDQALDRIEAGEDPDKVMEDIDPEAIGGMGAGDDEDSGELDDDYEPEVAGL